MQTSTDIFLDSEILSTDVASTDSHSPKAAQSQPTPKSDRSLLNSAESCDSDDDDDNNKPHKKHRRRYFGVKTLQSIFGRQHDGYSDVSSTTSDPERSPERTKKNTVLQLTPQFEENIHTFLSEMFAKNFPGEQQVSSPVGTKKYFSLHGQNLRVGKALRLCPNEDGVEKGDVEQRKEKLLARYVYKADKSRADGEGDPDFGTPV